MSRPPLPVGTWGKVKRTEVAPGRWVARARFRDYDGRTRLVEAWGKSGAAAERSLKAALTERATPTSDHCGHAGVAARRTVARRGQAQQPRDELDQPVRGAGEAAHRARRRRPADPGVHRGAARPVPRTVADKTGAPTARSCRTVLSSMFSLACRHDAVSRNVVRDTAPVQAVHKPPKALTERQVRTLRGKLAADRKAVAADLPDLVDYMLGTGVRIGECLALKWADLDLGAAAPTTITGTVVRVPGQGLVVQDHPKTAAGRRKLMLPAFVVAMLLRRRVEQADGGDLVFPSSVGTLRETQNVHRQWRAARDRAGFPEITPHVFRKSVATVIGLGDLRAAADRLGHSGTAVTERHYVQRTGAGSDARALLEVFGQPADEQ